MSLTRFKMNLNQVQNGPQVIQRVIQRVNQRVIQIITTRSFLSCSAIPTR